MITVDLVVVGAHLSGQPLNDQLVAGGAVLIGPTWTAPCYRLWTLDTVPPKPGLLRVTGDGASIAGERWRLPVAEFGELVAMLPAPMTIGPLRLYDGSVAPGFLVEAAATEGGADITAYGGWVAYLHRRVGVPSR